MKKTQESRIEDVLDALTMMHDNENGATITSILETFDVQPRVSIVLQALGVIQVLHGQPVVWLAGKPTEELAKKVYKLANSDKFRNRKRKRSTASPPKKTGLLIEEMPIGDLTNSQIVEFLRRRGVEVQAFEKKEL